MSTAELRQKLIDKISSIENDALLREASRLIDLEIIDIENPYVLSEEMEKAVSIAREQISNGDYLSHSEANIEIEEWFDK